MQLPSLDPLRKIIAVSKKEQPSKDVVAKAEHCLREIVRLGGADIRPPKAKHVNAPEPAKQAAK